MEFDFLDLGIVIIFISFGQLDYWIIIFKFSYAIMNGIWFFMLFITITGVHLFFQRSLCSEQLGNSLHLLRFTHSFLCSIIAYTSFSITQNYTLASITHYILSDVTSNLVFTLSLISIVNYRFVQTSLKPCLSFCVSGAHVSPVTTLISLHRYSNYRVSSMTVKFVYFCDFSLYFYSSLMG